MLELRLRRRRKRQRKRRKNRKEEKGRKGEKKENGKEKREGGGEGKEKDLTFCLGCSPEIPPVCALVGSGCHLLWDSALSQVALGADLLCLLK